MTGLAIAILIASIAEVLAVYALYPLLLYALQRFAKTRYVETAAIPSVTLVISAYNEVGVIKDKLENALSLDYPRERLEIMIVSDESNDGTDEIVESYSQCGVVLCRQVPRGGKSLGLTNFVPAAKGTIVVFSDANSMYKPDAIRELVKHFGDPQVGFVVGHQRYHQNGSQSGESESLYWRYETWLKINESRIGSVVCGDGAIYAIRKELFEPMRPDDINDFYIPLRIVAKGFRGVFEKNAVCYEYAADDFNGEFRRKVRIVNRSLRAVFRVPRTLNPLMVGFFAVELALHKLLRWFVPFFLLAAFISNGYLVFRDGRVAFQVLMACQLLFYGAAALRVVPRICDSRIVYIPYYFCLVNFAAFLGVLKCLSGRTISTWNPERQSQVETSLGSGSILK